MVQFSELAIPFILFLIGINTMFAAMFTLPGDQNNATGLFASISGDANMTNSINTYTNTIYDDINSIHNANSDTNNATNISIKQDDITTVLFNIANSVTGGGLGYVVKFVSFITQMVFGYVVWIDFFLKPSWHPFFFYIGSLLKGALLIIQIYALVSIFSALVGRRL